MNLNFRFTMKTLQVLLLAILCILPCGPLHAQAPGRIDTSFDPGSMVNGGVNAIVPTADGKIYIGGWFTTVRGAIRNRIARLNANGEADSGFNPGAGANGAVDAIALQQDGKVLIVGSFGSVGGTTRSRVARLNSDGSLDTSFDPGTGADATVSTVAVQADGKILIGGSFTTYNGTGRNRVARLNSDGSIDATFAPGTGADNNVRDIKVQPDGKIMIVGQFTNYNGTSRNRIARVNSNGSIDTTFSPGTGANGDVYSISLDTNGKIGICGFFTSYNGISRQRVARLNANGSLDSTFSPPNYTGHVFYSIAAQSDGKLIVAGILGGNQFYPYDHGRIYRLNADGSSDSTINRDMGQSTAIRSVAIQIDEKILFGGSFAENIMRAQQNGSLDSGFVANSGFNRGSNNYWPFTSVRTCGIQFDGKILSGGAFTRFATNWMSNLARLESGGSLDATFQLSGGFYGYGGNSINTVAPQIDGKVLAGGYFEGFGDATINHLIRFNADGSRDTTYETGSGPNNGINFIVPSSDGKIFIGGNFNAYNGTTRMRIARLHDNGNLDPTFDPGAGPNGSVLTLAEAANGKLYIGGDFTTYAGINRNRIALLNTDGTVDTSFTPGTTNGGVSNLIIQPDQKIIIAGWFTSYAGISRNRIARLNADGSLDTSFDPGTGFDSSIYSVVLQTDGKVVVGGWFTTFNGTPCNYIARLNSDGSLDSTFEPGSGANQRIASLALQADGKLVIGGEFDAYDGQARGYISRAVNDPAIQSLVASSTSRVEWLRSGSTPEVGFVTFESSSNGVDWTHLGSGTRVPGGWELTGISLPQNGQIRARGRASCGYYNGSSSLIEQVAAYSLVPEIAVSGNGVDIANGDATPDPADHTDFGQVVPSGGSLARVFTITNHGGGDLSLTGTPRVDISGSAAFSVTQQPASDTVAAGGGTQTFEVTFTPTSPGVHNATISIANDDPDEDPFTFALTGLGNTAPTFAGYSVSTPWQTAASLSLGKLLAKAADADGDALSVTAAGPASAQGGTAILQSGSILYTPPTAFSGTDSFSVTIADGYGASVSGTVTISVGPNPTSGGPGVNPPQITMLPGGSVGISSQGIPGRTYMVQRSTDLANWATIGTVTAATNGAVSFIDPSPPQPSAFYRLGRDVPEMNFWGNGSDGALSTTGNISFSSVQDGDVVVKQFSNLTINAGHTVTTSTRCRGLVIYVNGDCTINGTLSMTARGANVNPTLADSIPATGIRLARFKYGANETLAASDLGGTGLGGVGAAWRTVEANQLGISGTGRIYTIAREGGAGGIGISMGIGTFAGADGFTVANGTGGGGAGGVTNRGTGGDGGRGTCYSGGSGGGGSANSFVYAKGGNGSSIGGAGGNAIEGAGGGAGNPGGVGSGYGTNGETGTGGLLVLMVRGNLTVGATGSIRSEGSAGGNVNGGGSGGGRIIILHAGSAAMNGAVSAVGKRIHSDTSIGGPGSITIDRIDP